MHPIHIVGARDLIELNPWRRLWTSDIGATFDYNFDDSENSGETVVGQ